MFTYKLRKYLVYKLKAKNHYSLHSPFMYDSYNNVFLRARKKDGAYAAIEKIISCLKKNHQKIEVLDLGAGSHFHRSPSRTISSIFNNTSKQKKYRKFLALLTAYLKAPNFIELGTSFGISTLYVAIKNAGCMIDTIEGSPCIASIARKNFRSFNAYNISLHEGSFDDILPHLLTRQSPGVVYIDGNHTKEATLRYFEWIKQCACNETVIIFDDIYWSPGMTSAWDQIRHDKNITASIDMFEFGIVFFKKELSKQHFILRY